MKNAILISIDDLFNHVRHRDKFGVEVQTPNIDRLASMGTFFDQAYATTPVCSPSRATIVTGQSMFETGIFGNAEDFYKFIDVQETIFAAYKTAGYTTIANGKIFHSTVLEPGYASGIIDRATNPKGLKNETFGIPFGAGPAPDGTPDSAFWDYDVVSNAIEFLGSDAATAAPYFLTVGLVRPHHPTIAPQSYFDLYPLDEIVEAGISAEGLDLRDFGLQFLRDNDPPSATAARIQAYLASVSFADAQLGRLFDAMDEGGHWDDTTVLLFSDHGYQLGDRDFFGKFTLWEEAANAPLIVYDPDQAAAGGTVETPVSLNQIFPTMTDLSGIATPSSVSAQSFAALVDPTLGSHDAKPVLTFINGSLGMRDGDLRLIRYEDGSLELYDLAADPQQTVNLATDPANRPLLTQALLSLRDAAREEGIRLVGEAEELVFGAIDETIIASDAGRLIGGQGDDTYFIEAGAVPVESRNGGEDLVVFRAGDARDMWQYWLPAHIENLTVGVGVNEMTVVGNNLANRIVANNSRDAILTVNAGLGDDSVFGSLGADTLFGAAGSDILQGWRGDDVIVAGGGNDYVGGHNGNDRLVTGPGQDTVFGALGEDVFVFRPDQGLTTIARLSQGEPLRVLGRDFSSGVDTVELRGFELPTGADPLSLMRDTRDGAVFEASGTSILFFGIQTRELAADDFLVLPDPARPSPSPNARLIGDVQGAEPAADAHARAALNIEAEDPDIF